MYAWIPLLGALLGLIAGVALGVLSGVRRGGWEDRTAMIAAVMAPKVTSGTECR